MLRAMSSAVMVVPIFIPITTPSALMKGIISEFTSPTRIIVAAVDDSSIAVRIVPAITPRKGVFVQLFKIVFNLSPAISSTCLLNFCIAKRKSITRERMVMILLVMSILIIILHKVFYKKRIFHDRKR